VVGQIDGDEPRGRAVGVDVRLGAGAAVGVAGAVAPVDDVLAHGVRAGVGDGAQSQRVGRAFVGAAGPADGDRLGHVLDWQGEGGRGLHAVVVGGGDGHRGRGRAVGRSVRPVPGAVRVVLGHRAQRGGERHGAAALGIVESAAVADRGTFVDGYGRLIAGNRRRVV